jgi:hypothetical protein
MCPKGQYLVKKMERDRYFGQKGQGLSDQRHGRVRLYGFPRQDGKAQITMS